MSTHNISFHGKVRKYQCILVGKKKEGLIVCVEVFTAQLTQWGHVERGQFTLPQVYWAGLVL